MSLVLANKDFFVEDPLALISTWDGDEHTLQLYKKHLDHYTTHRLKFTVVVNSLIRFPYKVFERYRT